MNFIEKGYILILWPAIAAVHHSHWLLPNATKEILCVVCPPAIQQFVYQTAWRPFGALRRRSHFFLQSDNVVVELKGKLLPDL